MSLKLDQMMELFLYMYLIIFQSLTIKYINRLIFF